MAIDIAVSADIQKLLELPSCAELRLPQPSKLKVQLPTGGTLKAFADISKGIPTDCSMTFSLLLQIAPLLGGLECLVRVLKLLKPLIDLINGLTSPPPSPKVISDFAKAVEEVAECLLVPTPAAMIPFVRDILCLILRVLKCFLGQMKSIVGILGGLSLQLNAAKAAGNVELQKALECAQENAETAASHLTQSIEPIGVILELVGPFMGIAGVQPIQLPQLGSDADLESLNQTLETVQGVVGTIQTVVDALGGCS